MKQEMHKIVEEMILDDHPKSIFMTDASQTKVRIDQKNHEFLKFLSLLCSIMVHSPQPWPELKHFEVTAWNKCQFLDA